MNNRIFSHYYNLSSVYLNYTEESSRMTNKIKWWMLAVNTFDRKFLHVCKHHTLWYRSTPLFCILVIQCDLIIIIEQIWIYARRLSTIQHPTLAAKWTQFMIGFWRVSDRNVLNFLNSKPNAKWARRIQIWPGVKFEHVKISSAFSVFYANAIIYC